MPRPIFWRVVFQKGTVWSFKEGTIFWRVVFQRRNAG
jgi:hypothetical protein